MNFNSFGRAGRYSSHNGRGRGRGGRGGGRRGGRGGRHHGKNSHPNTSNKDFQHVHFIEASGTMTTSSFNVAIQGCSHGELDSIYAALEAYRDQTLNQSDPENGAQIDVLLCCGDVQTLRNTDDYHALAVPQKYKAMGDFHQYYSGEKIAPILTVMIGGNHEASNYLQELYYGGWVAPNIYYMGAAGVVNLCKLSPDKTLVSTLRIAGLSGIYKSHDYKLGRFEAPPYSQGELRSVYHTRHFEVERLRALASETTTKPIDIMISHDWPRGIEQHGNVNKLIQQKPFFKQEIESNSLGSPANEVLLHALKPRNWFAAHLHVKFQAEVRHAGAINSNADGEKKKSATSDANESTNFIGMESNEGICPNPYETTMESLTDQMTRFLSLDKCLPKRRHLQVLHIEPSSTRSASNEDSVFGDVKKPWLEYDPTWLAIHRRTEDWSQKTHNKLHIPQDEFDQAPITSDELQDINNRLLSAASGRGENNNVTNPMAIPLNFVQTARPYDPTSRQQYGPARPMVGNPQTDEFLEMLGIEHKLTVPFCNADTALCRAPLAMPMPLQMPMHVDDDNEIDLDGDTDEKINPVRAPLAMPAPKQVTNDVNEIDLDADDEAGDAVVHNNADPDEIDLDDVDEAGDSVCYSSESAVKRPRV
jgi:lariat debranching enzyme